MLYLPLIYGGRSYSNGQDLSSATLFPVLTCFMDNKRKAICLLVLRRYQLKTPVEYASWMQV